MIRRPAVCADAREGDRAELYWMEGMIGVLQNDATRYQNARRLFTDTTLLARHTSASLAAMWMNREDPSRAADSLLRVTDDVMRNGAYVLPAEALGRLLIARRLRQQNQPERVERYLMWGDGGMNTPSSVAARAAVGQVTTMERASALDAAGERDASISMYRQFINSYDMAPPAHREMLAEARARLAALEALDSRQSKTVQPTGKQ